jgi:PAS domain S-box-containing protein
MLNVLLVVGAVGGGVVLVVDIYDALRTPGEWVYALVYLVAVAFVSALAALRRFPYNLRAWGLVLIGFAGSAVLLFKGGLAGAGRLFLVTLPVLSTILMGGVAGLIAGVLAVGVFVAFGLSAQAGLVPADGIVQPSASFVQTWVGGGMGLALVIAALVVLQSRMGRSLQEIVSRHARLHEQSEELRRFHQSIVESVTDGIIVQDARGAIAYVNPAGAEMLGHAPDDLHGRPWPNLLAPGATVGAGERCDPLSQAGGARYETSLLTKEGDPIPVIVGSRSLVEDGNVAGTLLAVTDISDRRAAELALAESEQRLRTILEHMPVMVAASDESDTFVAWNRECERVTGYAADEIVGSPDVAERLYPGQASGEHTAAMWASLGGDYREYEQTVTCKNGEARTLMISNCSARHPVPGWANWGIAVDITDRKRAVEKLRESEATARAVLDATTESIILVDSDLVILDLNQTAARRLGGSREDLIGATVDTLVSTGVFSAELAESRRAALDDVARTGLPERREDERAGAVYDSVYYPVFSDDRQVRRLVVFSRDITAQRRAEHLARWSDRLTTIGRLTAALSHEMNNPLQALQSNLEILAGFDLVPGEEAAALDESLRLVQRVAAVSREVLAFSLPSDDEWSAFAANRIVDDAWTLMRERVREAGIEATMAVAEDSPMIRGSRLALGQVVVNLISNAIEAMGHGGRLDIGLGRQADEVVIEVGNDGPPLSDDELERVFDAYFTTKPEHVGIGLWVARHIVAEHNGVIEAANRSDGAGVVFTVRLPASGRGELGDGR